MRVGESVGETNDGANRTPSQTRGPETHREPSCHGRVAAGDGPHIVGQREGTQALDFGVRAHSTYLPSHDHTLAGRPVTRL